MTLAKDRWSSFLTSRSTRESESSWRVHARTHARVSVFWHWALGLEGLGWYRGHRYHHYRTAAADPRLWRIAWPARSRDRLPQKVWAARRVHIALHRAPSSFGPAGPLYFGVAVAEVSRAILRVRNRQSFPRSERLRRFNNLVVVSFSVSFPILDRQFHDSAEMCKTSKGMRWHTAICFATLCEHLCESLSKEFEIPHGS